MVRLWLTGSGGRRVSEEAIAPLSPRQVSRSAGATIKGYVYQFDRTILEILDLGPGGSVRVEGVEDVDLLGSIDSSAIQIKYMAATKYTSPKTLRDPILEMLRSFAEGREWIYVLHVHFGEGTPPVALTLAELKECLTKRTRTTRATELLYAEFDQEVLEQFVSRLEIRVGDAFDVQQGHVFSAIASHVGCSTEDAKEIHYSIALQFVQSRAMAADEADRVVTRESLSAVLNLRDMLYERWHRETVGLDKYKKAAIRRLKGLGFGRSDRHRAVVVEVDNSSVSQVIDLAVELSEDFIGKRRLTTAKPWSIILRGDEDNVRQVKSGLIQAKIEFNDGYEDILFSPWSFMLPPLMNTKKSSPIIDKASYSLRLVREPNFKLLADSGEKLAHLVVGGASQSWHGAASKDPPVQLRGLEINEIRNILTGVV